MEHLITAAKHCDLERVNAILETNRSVVNERDDSGFVDTPVTQLICFKGLLSSYVHVLAVHLLTHECGAGRCR